jgi:hypothetical protein
MKRPLIWFAIGFTVGLVIANLPGFSLPSFKMVAINIGYLLGLLGALLLLVGLTLRHPRIGNTGLVMLVAAAVFILGPWA